MARILAASLSRHLPRFIPGLAVAGLVVVALTDSLTPRGVAHGILYALLTVLAGLSGQRRWVMIVMALSLVLTGVGFWLSPVPEGYLLSGVANRLLSGMAIVLAGGLTLGVLHSQERIYRTLDSLPAGFLLLDTEGCFVIVNRRAEQLLQRDRHQLLGHNLWAEFPAAVGTLFQQQYDKALQTGQAAEFRAYYAPFNQWFEVQIYPLNRGMAVYGQDISDRVAQEERLCQTQRLEAIGQLAGGMAHDFNNLLTVIMGNADLLHDQLGQAPQLRSLAAVIETAADQGADLTQRLLAFARRQALVPKPVDLNRFLMAMDGQLRHTLGSAIDLDWRLDPSLGMTQVDPNPLASAIINLCHNAREAMPQGGTLTLSTAHVTLTEADTPQFTDLAPGQYVVMAFADTGDGIPADHLGRVIEPFFTTRPKGKGKGLGLSMVYGFVKQSGGHLKLCSEPGQGTTVRLYLPREVGTTAITTKTTAAFPTPRPPEPVAATTAERSDLVSSRDTAQQILLVDDDDLVRRYVQSQLQQLGYRVLAAPNGAVALNLIRQGAEIDLLFTDLVMPGGMDGRALGEAARQIRPDLKILYTSGYADQTILSQDGIASEIPLLSKPYQTQELAQKIRDVLAR